MDPERTASDDEQLIDDFFDGTLDSRARKTFKQRLALDERLRAQLELQTRIDEKLGDLFPVVEPVASHVVETAESLTGSSAFSNVARLRRLSWLAAAATLAGLWFYFLGADEGGPQTPYFSPSPLASVYHHTVQQGFEPYYTCEEEQRFAEVFSKRQDQPMRLLAMPAGARMLGLSYPGGLSRNTTAMLCVVDEHPVMLFVDRANADQPDAAKVPDHLAGTHVFRQQRDGLVIYEVTPLSAPRVSDFLVAE